MRSIYDDFDIPEQSGTASAQATISFDSSKGLPKAFHSVYIQCDANVTAIDEVILDADGGTQLITDPEQPTSLARTMRRGFNLVTSTDRVIPFSPWHLNVQERFRYGITGASKLQVKFTSGGTAGKIKVFYELSQSPISKLWRYQQAAQNIVANGTNAVNLQFQGELLALIFGMTNLKRVRVHDGAERVFNLDADRLKVADAQKKSANGTSYVVFFDDDGDMQKLLKNPLVNITADSTAYTATVGAVNIV